MARNNMRTVNIAPKWMGLARIVLDDLKRSDLPTKELAMTLLTDACEALDELNDRAEKHNFVELDNEKLVVDKGAVGINDKDKN